MEERFKSENIGLTGMELDLSRTLIPRGYCLLKFDSTEGVYKLEFYKSLSPPQYYPRYHLTVVMTEGTALGGLTIHYDVAPHQSRNNKKIRVKLTQEIRTLAESLENEEGETQRFLLEKLKFIYEVLNVSKHPNNHKTQEELTGKRGRVNSGIQRKQRILRRLEDLESNGWREEIENPPSEV